MKLLQPKRPRLSLEANAYKKLVEEVLRRDGWQCQNCGRRTALQVHHLVSRAQEGDDAEGNLITLCAGCHRAAHEL